MKNLAVFSKRNIKELIRDPLNCAFALGFPVAVMLLLTAIQSNIPTDMFEIQKITPGMAVFGFSFISLFSGVLISKDRTSSFMMRLYASPMKAHQFILGYILPILPLAFIQSLICFITAMILGLSFTFNIFLSLICCCPPH